MRNNPTYEILKKLGVMQFESWEVDNALISYTNFLQIMMRPDSALIVYGGDRTIREKWKLLQRLGFAKKVNQGDIVRFDIAAVKNYIAAFEAME